jgi:peptide deformylase
MIREILKYGHFALAAKAVPFSNLQLGTPAITRLVTDLFDTLDAAKSGVGLAAPQIGESAQAIVISLPTPEGRRKEALINPKIIGINGRALRDEGCLSLPGLYSQVERPEKIVVEYYTPEGRFCQRSAEGFLARVLCHEIDHLDGVVFIDRIDRQPRRRILRQIEDAQQKGKWS